MKADDACDRLSAYRNRDIVGSQYLAGWLRIVRRSNNFRSFFQSLFALPVATEQNQITKDKGWIGDVKVRAFADGFFHPVGQITERPGDSFAGDCHHRTDAVTRHDHVYVLCFQAAENGAFSAAGERGIIMQDWGTTGPSHDPKRRARRNVIRIEAAFDDKAARHIPVKRLDVTCTLGFAEKFPKAFNASA
ncbi:hypothetical protein C9413_08875 [Rhizobium sp. SEMIA 4085]|uniref:hypothetical protein n=1 Tax=Rhizobium TaxID=379 RepID=UPI000AF4E1AB|nr:MULTISPECIES: hypothetical protein [Rhizobium]NNH29608.1 hypothetical protein [Rhizobium sp. SEMIA 4085]